MLCCVETFPQSRLSWVGVLSDFRAGGACYGNSEMELERDWANIHWHFWFL
jgi:hypothetical protein